MNKKQRFELRFKSGTINREKFGHVTKCTKLLDKVNSRFVEFKHLRNKRSPALYNALLNVAAQDF